MGVVAESNVRFRKSSRPEFENITDLEIALFGPVSKFADCVVIGM
jgi:hypothetical protein